MSKMWLEHVLTQTDPSALSVFAHAWPWCYALTLAPVITGNPSRYGNNVSSRARYVQNDPWLKLLFGKHSSVIWGVGNRVKRRREEFPVLADRFKQGLSKQADQGVRHWDRQLRRQVGWETDKRQQDFRVAHLQCENSKSPQPQEVTWGCSQKVDLIEIV